MQNSSSRTVFKLERWDSFHSFQNSVANKVVDGLYECSMWKKSRDYIDNGKIKNKLFKKKTSKTNLKPTAVLDLLELVLAHINIHRNILFSS